MKRVNLLILPVILCLSVLSLDFADAANQEKPNIICILADDIGLSDISCYGGDHTPTPNIDSLAKEGLRFSACYSTPFCGPSRCQLLTGRYPFRTGRISNSSGDLPRPGTEIMIPAVMKQAGYATTCVGKWGQVGGKAPLWGFDESLSFAPSGYYWTGGKQGKKKTEDNAYMPDKTHKFIVDFITKHREQPFFLYYPMVHVHNAIGPTPDSRPNSTAKIGSAEFHADNIRYMDKLVGQLVSELDRLKLRDKTLILFAGDNGSDSQAKDTPSTLHGRKINGKKGTLLEGGSRVPLIANCPGIVPKGKVNDDLIDFSDLFATFAGLAGAKLPEGVKLDSRSFAPQLKGEKGTPREWVFVQLGKGWYARDARYKLTHDGKLFDLKDAPFVETPVAAGAGDAGASDSRKRLQAVLDELKPVGGADMEIDAAYPGGNIVFERIEGDRVYLHQDLRNTPIWWFYWNYRVRGAAGRTLVFHFTNRKVIDLHGPAVSLDEGATWSWLGSKSVSGASFSYPFGPDAGSVRFCYAIPYQEADLARFLSTYTNNPHLKVETLCQTRKGRNVERLRLGKLDGEPQYRVVLTCRHHACEMMASWTFEGVLAAILADDDLGRWFQENVEVAAIPFMDKDGVEEGDQGKRRGPHDHAEDYAGDPIYPSVQALKEFLPEWAEGKLRIAIDMHNPYIHDSNLHWVLVPDEPYLSNTRTFLDLLEKVRQGPLSYSPKNEWVWQPTAPPIGTKPFGWFATLPGVMVPTALELPYSTAGGKQVTPDNARVLGRDIARAMRAYLTKSVASPFREMIEAGE
jgi:arylsulfatase A